MNHFVNSCRYITVHGSKPAMVTASQPRPAMTTASDPGQHGRPDSHHGNQQASQHGSQQGPASTATRQLAQASQVAAASKATHGV